ncbi:MAG TPA: hypothetical protein VIY54_07565 [Steroidobacteraceae bacterium]
MAYGTAAPAITRSRASRSTGFHHVGIEARRLGALNILGLPIAGQGDESDRRAGIAVYTARPSCPRQGIQPLR